MRSHTNTHAKPHTPAVPMAEWALWVVVWAVVFAAWVAAWAPQGATQGVSSLAPWASWLVGYGALSVILHRHATRWGWASRVTLVRALITLSLASFLWWPEAFRAHGLALGVMGLVALLADGLDGYLARRLNEASAVGARFDMETDAALMAVLAVGVWWIDRAGAWVLLIGLMRYAFIIAGRVWPRLRGELDASMRRKVICVVQVSVLLLVLPPWLSASQAAVVLGAALALLVYSFWVDTLALLKQNN